MLMDKQIIFSLLIMNVILLWVILAVVRRFSLVNTASVGLGLGEKLSPFEFETIEGEKINMDRLDFEQEMTYLILDANCSECSKIIKTLNTIDSRYLNSVRLIFAKSDNNLKLNSKELEKRSLFVSQEYLFNKLKISTFPFFLTINSNREIIKKGNVSQFNLFEEIIVQNV